MVESELKSVALHFMRRGQISPNDVAWLARVDPKTAWRWAKEAGIDFQGAHGRRIRKLWVRRASGYAVMSGNRGRIDL